MISAFAIVATIIAIACGVLIYAVGTISQRAERKVEESYRELLKQLGVAVYIVGRAPGVATRHGPKLLEL